MIETTIAEIEERLRGSESIKAENRAELLQLLATLKSEVGQLSATHGEQAQSIAQFTQLSAHEATRQRKNPDLMQHAMGGLSASVVEFEKSHPRLVEAVNRICTTLSNLGI